AEVDPAVVERSSEDGEREVALRPLRGSREWSREGTEQSGTLGTGQQDKGKGKEKEEANVHYVKEGDTLARIAIMYGVKNDVIDFITVPDI
ncbi:hypothetical protein HDV00_012494, partial [Rhizophlyctis rosea]